MILDIQDIINSVSVPALIKDDFIKRGKFRRLPNGDLQVCVGGFSVVFLVEVDGESWAFRCWHHTLDAAQSRIKCLSDKLKRIGLPYFINFDYSEQGIIVNGCIYPTTRMRWINGRNIKEYICYYQNDSHKLFELAANFFKMTQDLHRCSIAHGDLQHENILVDQYGKIFLIDYDSMYIPEESFSKAKNTTNGKDGYQHPARANCIYAGKKLDYFSEVIILTSILAIAYKPELIKKYDFEDSDTMLFKKSDFVNFVSTKIFSDLSKLGEIFVILLKVIQHYLGKTDIDDLSPLENAVNLASPTNAICIADYLKNAEQKLKEQKEEEFQKKDILAWEKAYRLNSVQSYNNYLTSFPYGKYANDARRKLKSIERSKRIGKTIKRLFWSCAAIVSIVVVGKIVIENIERVPNSQNVYKGSQISTKTYNHQTTTKQSESQASSLTGNSNNIESLEKELETKLSGMEMAKRYGDPINRQTLNEAESLLNKVKSSSRYSYYQQRINALK